MSEHEFKVGDVVRRKAIGSAKVTEVMGDLVRLDGGTAAINKSLLEPVPATGDEEAKWERREREYEKLTAPDVSVDDAELVNIIKRAINPEAFKDRGTVGFMQQTEMNAAEASALLIVEALSRAGLKVERVK